MPLYNKYAVVDREVTSFDTLADGGVEYYGYVDILIYDSTTYQPTTGDYMNVNVQMQNNGVGIVTQQYTVIGQSLRIFGPSILQRSGSSNDFAFSWVITDTSQGTVPVVNICDLVIVSIAVNDPESSPGASDGQITVNATSSHGPIQYSLDNTTWQTSNVFTGLSSGLKTVYVKDANSCTANSTVTVPLVNNLLTGDPTATVAGTNVSRWSAAFNPVFFTYQRKDFEITSITQDGNGKAVLHVNADLTGLPAGSLIYVNAGNYKATFVVSSSDINTISIPANFNGNATGYVNINYFRPYYKIFTEISYIDEAGAAILTKTYQSTPDVSGVVISDISGFLKSLLNPVDSSDYSVLNFRDNNLSASYTIRYQESWDGQTNPKWVTLADPYYVTYSAMQLQQSKLGGNMGDYVPFPTNSAAKFVTDFVSPAYSIGYPFDIGFIYSEKIAGLSVYAQITPLDINKNPLPTGTINTYLLNEDGSFLLNSDGGKYIIASQTFANNVLKETIAQHVGLNRLLINTSFPDGAWYFNLALFYNDTNNNPVQITETKLIRIEKAIDINSVYVRWIGFAGSWEYYRFVYNQEKSITIANTVSSKRYVKDWANEQTIEQIISRDAVKGLKVMAVDLTQADIDGLTGLRASNTVQLLVPNSNPYRWLTISQPDATYTEYETQTGQYAFEMQFTLPSLNLQTR